VIEVALLDGQVKKLGWQVLLVQCLEDLGDISLARWPGESPVKPLAGLPVFDKPGDLFDKPVGHVDLALAEAVRHPHDEFLFFTQPLAVDVQAVHIAVVALLELFLLVVDRLDLFFASKDLRFGRFHPQLDQIDLQGPHGVKHLGGQFALLDDLAVLVPGHAAGTDQQQHHQADDDPIGQVLFFCTSAKARRTIMVCSPAVPWSSVLPK
jgi:hypothetical protein